MYLPLGLLDFSPYIAIYGLAFAGGMITRVLAVLSIDFYLSSVLPLACKGYLKVERYCT